MYANIAHYTALYTNVVAKLGSDTSVLLLSYVSTLIYSFLGGSLSLYPRYHTREA